MPAVEWKAAAVADLMAIIDVISDDNPAAALALLEQIEGRVSRLADHPRAGRSGRAQGTRELVAHPNYVVVYSETGTTVTVLRVLHAAQMWP